MTNESLVNIAVSGVERVVQLDGQFFVSMEWGVDIESGVVGHMATHGNKSALNQDILKWKRDKSI